MRWMLAAVLVLLVVAPAARAEPPFRPLDSFDRLAVAGRVDHGNNGSTDTIFVTTRLSDTKSQTVALLERAHGPFLGYLDVSWSSGAASLAATEWLFQGLDKRLAIYEFPGGGLAARLDTELDTVRVPSEAHACTGNPDSACPRDVGRSRWGGTTLDPRILVPVAAAGIVSIRPDGSGASVLPNTHGTRGGIGFAPEQDLFTDGRRVSNGPAQTKPDGTTYDDLALSVPPDQLTKLTDTAFIDDHNPAFSPDGRRVAYLQEGRLAIINTDGSDAHLITPDSTIGYGPPAWKPDGSRIAFLGHSSTLGQKPAIYSLKPDGTDLVRHTSAIDILSDPIPFTNVKTGVDGARVAWGRTCTTIFQCNAALSVVPSQLAGFSLQATPLLPAAASIGFLVERYTGRRLRRVGRVPFGAKRRGHARVRWGLKLHGRRLRAGRYRITLRSLARKVPIGAARPRDLIVPRHGKPRLTRARVR
jgi:hypothetical protein